MRLTPLHPIASLAGLVLSAWLAAPVASQQLEWIEQFGGTTLGTTRATAVDASGYVYVAGWTNGSFPGQTAEHQENAYVRKYDGALNLIWTRQFSPPSSRGSHATSVALDTSGDIYVTGVTSGVYGRGMFLTKLDSDGNEQWTVAEADVAGFSDIAIVCPAYDGVYFIGYVPGDVVVRRYFADGTELWEYSLAARPVLPQSACSDLTGVYIAGGYNDTWLIKLAPNGALTWDAPSVVGDWGRSLSVAVGGSGLFLTGRSPMTYPDYAVWHFDPGSGMLRHTVPSGATILAAHVGAGDGLYVTGGPYRQPYVTKYDTSEATPPVWAWSIVDPTFMRIFGLVETGGNVFSVGHLPETGGPVEARITKRAGADGSLVTAAEFISDLSATDTIFDVAVDGGGFVFVAGSTNGSFLAPAARAQRSFLRGYQEGSEIWTKEIERSTGQSIVGISAADSGVYVVTSVQGSFFEPMKFQIQYYDWDGSEIWGSALVAGNPKDIETQGPNVLILASTTSPPATKVSSFDALGDPVSEQLLDFTSVVDLAVAGNAFYVFGYPSAVRKYGPTGLEWTLLNPSIGTPVLSADPTGVYLLVNTYNTGTGLDFLLTKYGSDSSPQWARQLGTSQYEDQPAIAAYGSAVYVTGQTNGSFAAPGDPAGPRSLFVHKAGADGSDLWTLQFGQVLGTGGISGLVQPKSIAVGTNGVYVGGFVWGDVAFPTDYNNSDAFLARLTESGGTVDTELPIVVAGDDQSIHAGVTVHLDGTNSIDNVTPDAELRFAWEFYIQPSGSIATFTAPTAATTSFVADRPGEYVVKLVVTDLAGNAGEDLVVISSENIAPTADAGLDRIVVAGVATALDGLGSYDPDADPLQYGWSLVSQPAASAATLIGADTATPTLTPDLVGEYELELVVSDGFEDSAPVTVTITAITAAAYAEMRLLEASDATAAFAESDFDAPGHRNYFTNNISKVVGFVQRGQLEQARDHLDRLVERTDGCHLGRGVDPKGMGLAFAADFIVTCSAQATLYAFLEDARNSMAP